jgi:hypothetical protein
MHLSMGFEYGQPRTITEPEAHYSARLPQKVLEGLQLESPAGTNYYNQMKSTLRTVPDVHIEALESPMHIHGPRPSLDKYSVGTLHFWQSVQPPPSKIPGGSYIYTCTNLVKIRALPE